MIKNLIESPWRGEDKLHRALAGRTFSGLETSLECGSMTATNENAYTSHFE
jgi:hypothetical protein